MDRNFVGQSGFTFVQNHGTFQVYGHNNGQTSSTTSFPSTTTTTTTVQRMTRPDTDQLDDRNLSLVQKLKAHYQHRSATSTNSRHFFRALFQFQAVTQLYMTLTYLIPYAFSDYDPTTQYYLKVLACYVFAMGEANWLCAIFYSNSLPDIRDRPNPGPQDWFENSTSPASPKGEERAVDSRGLEWKFCSRCQRFKPPRTHHCLACRSCVLRRDHHCFLIGRCVGHYNQRYFIVFCFLGVLTGLVGFCLTASYLTSSALAEEAYTYADYVFPWSLIKFAAGRVSWQFLLLTFHAEMLVIFGAMSLVYGVGQFSLVCMGCTLYEVAKQVDIKVTSTRGENIRMVFGDYWLLNFFLPAQILFKQRHDGMHYDNIKIGANKHYME